MSIADAAKMYLQMVRQKRNTSDIIKALADGGLPPTTYSVLYSILRRREKQVGDVINIGSGDWGLAEWFPNHRKRKPSTGREAEQQEQPEAQDEANGDDVFFPSDGTFPITDDDVPF